MQNHNFISTRFEKDVFISPQTGVTFLSVYPHHPHKVSNIVSYVWEGQLPVHLKFLRLMGISNIRKTKFIEVTFLKGFSASAVGSTITSVHELSFTWHNLKLLSDFYWATSVEVLLLTLRAFKIRLFAPRFLPNLFFLTERLKNRFPQPVEPLCPKNLDAMVARAVDTVKRELPEHIVRLGEAAWFICSEVFSLRFRFPPITVADRQIHLRGVKRNQIQALIWLLYLLDDKENEERVGEFLLKALKVRTQEAVNEIERWVSES